MNKATSFAMNQFTTGGHMREKTFEEEMQPILDSVIRREEFAKSIAGQHLSAECQVFRLPLPQEAFVFNDPSTHNTKRGPNYLYIFVRQESDKGIAKDRDGELLSIPINELVNYEYYSLHVSD